MEIKDLARKEISELQNRLRTELDADLDDINTKAKKITLIFNFMDSNILKKLKELGKCLMKIYIMIHKRSLI